MPGRCYWFCAACAEMRLRIEIPAKAPNAESAPKSDENDDLCPENVDKHEDEHSLNDEDCSRWRLIEID
jgi:hypothetical protein